jgi:oxygen-independent coproporphyrinogen III oxidase
LIGDYLKALALELESLETPRLLDTLFLGGGTPTHLPFDALEHLLDLMNRWFRSSSNYEFSIEANPDGLTQEKARLMSAKGVNRVSLGVQSFDSGVLRTLERSHTAPLVDETLAMLHHHFENVSLDLIFGVPGQSLESWRATLAHAVSLGPQHVSTYGLTWEKGTAFWSRRAKGALAPLDDETERAMYAAAMDDLAAAGFVQYELSNFARAGYRCRHNETYWTGGRYYGFGPGAARYLGVRREINHRSVTTWMARVLSGVSPVGGSEELSPEERAREALVIGLRRTEGVVRSEFREQTGFDLDLLAHAALSRQVSRGLIEDLGTSIRLTREGRFLADTVIVDLV